MYLHTSTRVTRRLYIPRSLPLVNIICHLWDPLNILPLNMPLERAFDLSHRNISFILLFTLILIVRSLIIASFELLLSAPRVQHL